MYWPHSTARIPAFCEPFFIRVNMAKLLALWISIMAMCAVINAEADVIFTIDPATSFEVIDKQIEFSCSLSGDHGEVFVVDIYRDDKEKIAVLRADSSVTFNDDGYYRFQGQGIIDNENGDVTLNVTLAQPTTEDAGHYSCDVSYFDDGGSLKQSKASAYLNIENALSINGTTDLTKALQALTQRMDNDNRRHDKEIHNLKKVVHQQTMQINTFEKQSCIKTDASVFSATSLDRNMNPGPGEKIIFDKTTWSQGKGYNNKTGVFTSQIQGFYAFHLTIGAWSVYKSWTQVNITVNDQPKARLQTVNSVDYNLGKEDQRSINLVTKLNAGDTVKVVADEKTGRHERIDGTMSSFSGYLLA